jgi:hypothetical protein
MPSQAYTNHLDILLADAAELNSAHTRLRTGNRGRQWGLGALNRAVVVLCVSAWEAYLEEIIKESVEAMRPAAPPMGSWSSLKATALSEIGRFNNPNVDNTTKLFASCLGLPDVTVHWAWRNCSRATAREYLNDALKQRHQIAHGVNPRPTVHNAYAQWLPNFFRNLGRHTDIAVLDQLTTQLHVAPPPW